MRLQLRTYLSLFSLLFCIHFSTQAQWSQYGSPINGQNNNDQLGYDVDINDAGDRVVVNLPFYANNNVGRFEVYEYTNGGWSLLGQAVNGTAGGEEAGWSVAMNAAGDRVAIGSPFYNIGGTSKIGRVRVFRYNGTSWVQMGSPIVGEAAQDRSGWSVDINAVGDRVVIGARTNDGNGSNSGHARLYEYSGSAWVQQGTDFDGLAADDNFGHRAAINAAGDVFIVGAKRGHVNAGTAG
jgi:hypothetical protein